MSQAHVHDVTATLTVDGLDEELHVIRFSGEEGISRLFRFTLELASPAFDIDFGAVLGARAALTLSRGGQQRIISGVVGAFRQDDGTDRFALYELSLVPEAWRLTHRRDCRIHQDIDALTIVEGILRDAHLGHDVRPRGGQRPAARPYCVQYREADWSFISRLLEQEGFYYFFAQQGARQVLTISNDPQVNRSVVPGGDVIYRPGGAMPGQEHVFGISVTERVLTGRVTLDDYSHTQPDLDLACAAEAAGPDAGLGEYDYPGGFALRERGRALAQVRLQQQRVEQQVMEGRSDCARFAAGGVFGLTGHPRADLNDDYLLWTVRHRGESEADLEAGTISPEVSYENSFRCVRRQVPFRPPRQTPWPRIRGAQTATVVGPPGEEVHTDAQGRVMVRFHWDRSGSADERASCWIRVGQLWAGNGWGGLFLPRVGQEVIVTFLEGDPDRPLITGCVYNGANTPPTSLPERKTVSTIRSRSSVGGGGFNEIRFEDNKGSEQLYTHAQRDRVEEVGQDRTTTVGRDQALEVGRDATRKVAGDETAVIEGDRSVQVDGAATVLTRGDLQVVTRGDGAEQTDGTHTLSANKIVLRAAHSIELQCGGASVSLDALGNVKITGTAPVSMDGPLVKINAGVTGRPAARLGDPSTPAAVVAGSPTVLVGEAPSVPAAAAAVGGAVKDTELSKAAGEDVHLPKQPDLVKKALDAARAEVTRRVGQLQNQLGVSDMTRALELGREAVTSAQGSVTSVKGAHDDVLAASDHASSAVDKGMDAVGHLGQLGGHLGDMVQDASSGNFDRVAGHFNRAMGEAKEVVKDMAGVADEVASGLDKMADAAEKSARAVDGVREAAGKILKGVSSLGDGAGKLGGFLGRAARWGEQFGLLRPGTAARLSRAGEGVAQLGKTLTSVASDGEKRLEGVKKVAESIRGIGSQVSAAGQEVSGWGKRLEGIVADPAASAGGEASSEALAAHVEQEQGAVAEAGEHVSAAAEQSHEASETLRHPSTSLGWRNTAATPQQLEQDARHAAPQVQQMVSEVCLETGTQGTLQARTAGPTPPALPPRQAQEAPRQGPSPDETMLLSTEELLEQSPELSGQTGDGPLMGVLVPTDDVPAEPVEPAGDASSQETMLLSMDEVFEDVSAPGADPADSAETTLIPADELAQDAGAAPAGAGDSRATAHLPPEATEAPPEAPQPPPTVADPESVPYARQGPGAADLPGATPTDPARSDGAVQSTVTVDQPEQLRSAARELAAQARARGGEAVFDSGFDRPDPTGHGDVHGTLLLPTEDDGLVMSRVHLVLRTYHDGSDQSLQARSARLAAAQPEGGAELTSRKQQARWLLALLALLEVVGSG